MAWGVQEASSEQPRSKLILGEQCLGSSWFSSLYVLATMQFFIVFKTGFHSVARTVWTRLFSSKFGWLL